MQKSQKITTNMSDVSKCDERMCPCLQSNATKKSKSKVSATENCDLDAPQFLPISSKYQTDVNLIKSDNNC